MNPRRTTHLVLLLIALLWTGMVFSNLDYAGRFLFHYVFISIKWLQVLLILLSLGTGFMLLTGALRRPATGGLAATRPFVSIMIPARNEERVIAETVRNLARLDYHQGGRRRYEIIVIDDGSSDDTPRILRRLQREVACLRVVRRESGPSVKAAALNFGLRSGRGPLLAVFDADARVAPDFLQRMVFRLDDEHVAAVQGRVLLYNRDQNLLTRVQYDEADVLMATMLRARNALATFVTVIGNGMVIRKAALAAVGGWNDQALVEDIDISVRFYLQGWRVRFAEDAIVWQEAVYRAWPLLRQRARWGEGGLRALGQHLPAILRAPLPGRVRADMLFLLSGGLIGTLALITTQTLSLLRFAGIVVLFLQVPRPLLAGTSAFLALAVLAAAVSRRGWHPVRLASVLIGMGALAMHHLILTPVTIYRYVKGALTGEPDWAKTDHLGEAEIEGDAAGVALYIRRV